MIGISLYLIAVYLMDWMDSTYHCRRTACWAAPCVNYDTDTTINQSINQSITLTTHKIISLSLTYLSRSTTHSDAHERGRTNKERKKEQLPCHALKLANPQPTTGLCSTRDFSQPYPEQDANPPDPSRTPDQRHAITGSSGALVQRRAPTTKRVSCVWWAPLSPSSLDPCGIMKHSPSTYLVSHRRSWGIAIKVSSLDDGFDDLNRVWTSFQHRLSSHTPAPPLPHKATRTRGRSCLSVLYLFQCLPTTNHPSHHVQIGRASCRERV